jgi:hypothetical protein
MMERPRGYTGFIAFLAFSGPMRRMTWRLRVAIVILVFPVLTLLTSLAFWVEGVVYKLRSVPVEGTVVQLYERPGESILDRGVLNYEPVFTYEMNGETRRASVGSGHSSFNIPAGETATIRAIPSSRGNVRLATWQGLWFVPAMLSILGVAMLAVLGPLWLWVDRRFFVDEIFYRKDTA